MDFGFDDGEVVKQVGCDQFKQNRPKEISRVSIIALKSHHDVILSKKQSEEGRKFSDEEKNELFKKIDAKIAEKIGKPASELTDVDRLSFDNEKFKMAYTHYKDGVGTFRCLSKRENNEIVKKEVCCSQIGDADQTVATIILQYPLDSDGDVDVDLLNQKKQTHVWVYKMNAGKFQKLHKTIKDARKKNGWGAMDLKIELDDGDVKFQKQIITSDGSAIWANKDIVTDSTRAWILERGLSNYKYTDKNLGKEMKITELIQKLNIANPEKGGYGDSERRLQTKEDYKNMLD